MAPSWLDLHRGDAPLIISLPHTGTEIPDTVASGLVSPWLARKDADWWVDRLYDFAADLGATTVRTRISRTVIDVNRDPGGASLYPGQATTGLCPLTTFDGEPLYQPGDAPDEAAVALRRAQWFDPYHAALSAEIDRLRDRHDAVVLYEAHAIRSTIPRLFEGALPNFNIGTNSGQSCAAALTREVATACQLGDFSHVVDGRFKGGYTTRHYGRPGHGVHAIQMELACRGYMDEPSHPSPDTWPTPYDPVGAQPMRAVLSAILHACLTFARAPEEPA